ncbi:MAG: DEAD/DEAH box helicase family protein, partial [Ferruginibacter sp.]|nr:DEAD/DEAH box helicase family protein [Ferruginibacter sp.]
MKPLFLFMVLREYQEKLCLHIAQKLAQGKRKIVAQLATGGGKTISFAAISNRYTLKSGKSILILVHRKELLQQTRRTLYNAFKINCQIIIAGMKHVPPAPVYVGMVESVSRRIDRINNVGMVIIDECHIANFNKIHEHFPDAYFIGFTATPQAASKEKPLNLYYDDIVCGIDIPELIGMGSLCPNQTFAAKDAVNRSALKMKGGEFDTGLMGIEFSKQQHVNNTVTIYKEKAESTKAIVFNSTIDHSLKVTDAFINAGYDCRHFDGETESKERSEVLAWFESTPGAILCNVGIATTGFDEPTIETVIVNRSTMSMPLWLQMTGRGSRPTDLKIQFTIIDMGGNAITHGDWCDSRDWENIFFNPPKKGKEGVAPVKNCPKCDSIVAASTMVCKFCGHLFPPPVPKIEEELAEFIMVTKNMDVLQMIEQNRHRKEYYSFFQIAQTLAAEIRFTVPQMNQERFEYALLTYYEKAKIWCANTTGEKRRTFNQWHKDLAKKTLIEQLQKHYK